MGPFGEVGRRGLVAVLASGATAGVVAAGVTIGGSTGVVAGVTAEVDCESDIFLSSCSSISLRACSCCSEMRRFRSTRSAISCFSYWSKRQTFHSSPEYRYHPPESQFGQAPSCSRQSSFACDGRQGDVWREDRDFGGSAVTDGGLVVPGISIGM